MDKIRVVNEQGEVVLESEFSEQAPTQWKRLRSVKKKKPKQPKPESETKDG